MLCWSGCDTAAIKPPDAASSAAKDASPASSSDWGGLEVKFDGESWQTASRVVILLHGYGASGDDLVPLAGLLAPKSSTAFLFPQAPIAIGKNEFAWARGVDAELEQSRQRVTAIIEQVRRDNPRSQIIVGGFSQGGTISCNLLAEGDPPLDGIILFSPNPTQWREVGTSGHRPKVFISHGRHDGMIGFAEVEKLKDLLVSKGFQVNWKPFNGDHEITAEIVQATRRFLASLAADSLNEQSDTSR